MKKPVTFKTSVYLDNKLKRKVDRAVKKTLLSKNKLLIKLIEKGIDDLEKNGVNTIFDQNTPN